MMEGISKTSMLYWFPKIRDLNIPMPKTEIVRIPYVYLASILDGKRLPMKYMDKIHKAGEKIGYPLFLRTDMGSAKHSWKTTCFVEQGVELLRHAWSLIDTTLAMGMFGELDPNALVFREFLHLESAFNAFDGLPIARERRYFIKDGEVICHHPYWIQDAVEKDWSELKPSNWREMLTNMNYETIAELEVLKSYVGIVAKTLPGYWSVDFAKEQGGTWYLIDIAEGEKSWHPKHDD